MSRVHLTGAIAALALAAFAPRLAAQDTSSAGVARPDTSGYSGAAGVDTSARPGRVGAIDTTCADTAGADTTGMDTLGTDTTSRDSTSSTRTGADTMAAPGRADADSTGPLGSSDTSGMRGRHPEATQPGSSEHPSAAGTDSGSTNATDSGANSTSSGTNSTRSGTSPTTSP